MGKKGGTLICFLLNTANLKIGLAHVRAGSDRQRLMLPNQSLTSSYQEMNDFGLGKTCVRALFKSQGFSHFLQLVNLPRILGLMAGTSRGMNTAGV